MREHTKESGVVAMTNVELLGLIISIASLILAVFALAKSK